MVGHASVGALLALAIGAACSEEVAAPIRSELPLEKSDRSVIVGLLRDQTLELRALRVADGNVSDPWSFPLTGGDHFRLFALAYEESLETLGLAPGMIEPALHEELSAPLPRAARVFEQSFASGDITKWSEKAMSDLDPSITEFRVSIAARCVDFQLTTLEFLHLEAPRFAVDAGGKLLFGDLAGRLYVSPPGGPITELAQTQTLFDAYADDAGTLWLSGTAGAIYRGALRDTVLELTLDSTVALASGNTRDVLFLDGDKTAGADDRFALTQGGFLARGDQSGWFEEFLGHGPRGIAWVGTRDVRTVQGYEHELFHTSDPDPEHDGDPDLVSTNTIDGGVTTVAFVRGKGLYAGLEFGRILRRIEEDNWMALTLEPVLEQIRGIAEYPAGFVYARPDAVVQVLEPETPSGDPNDPQEQACPNGQAIAQPNDPSRPDLGFEIGGAIDYGPRTELTVVGRDVAVFGTRLEGQVRRPVLFWLLAPE